MNNGIDYTDAPADVDATLDDATAILGSTGDEFYNQTWRLTASTPIAGNGMLGLGLPAASLIKDITCDQKQ